ncbi:MAG: leucyl/phenylalanyl-tRNA--protein transferase [Pseudomonadota bacterium]
MKNNQYPYFLSPQDVSFPPVNLALKEPDGLLAIGGDLSSERIVSAYHQGIFPWYSADEPIMWWSPDPRSVIFTADYSPSKSLKKLLKKNTFSFSFDRSFEQVIRKCAQVPRRYQDGTWITEEMLAAYFLLHQQGIAHSCECWLGDELVGGLYGLSFGQVFFGESMFSTQSNASKLAFSYLVKNLKQWGFKLIDCQVESEHMNSLGAINVERQEFIALLDKYLLADSQAAWSS